MYGWITFALPILNFPEWDFTQTPATSDTTRQAKGRSVMTLASTTFQNKDQRNSFVQKTFAILKEVPEEHWDYAIQMSLAFFNRHGAGYKAKIEDIEKSVDAEFDDKLPSDDKSGIAAMIARLKSVGILLPDINRSFTVNAFCSALRDQLVVQPPTASKELARLRLLLKRLIDATAKCEPDHQTAISVIGRVALCSSQPSELAEMSNFAGHLIDTKRTDVFVALERCYNDARINLPWGNKYWAVRQGLKTAAANPRCAAEDVSHTVFTLAMNLNQLEDEVLIRETIAAVDAGADLGPNTASTRAALRQWREWMANGQRQQTQALIADAQRQATAGAHPMQPAQGMPDRETLQTWSLDQLVRWIEGPVTGPRRKRLNRKQVLDRVRASQPQPSTGAMMPSGGQATSALLTEAQLNKIGNEGYGAAAAYFLDDIKELIALGKQLKADDGLLRNCALMIDRLEPMSQAPAKFDEDELQQALTEAESLMDRVRASVHTIQAEAALKDRFMIQLVRALELEALTPGRRHGGVIQCPLRTEDWGWVVERYHRRWLSSARTLVIDDLPVRLDANQAVALYVTGSSQSDYAFDVSVHLWRRDEGKASLPAKTANLAQDPYPPMNADEWYDTYVTCCVLHVPRTK
ncbi:hypothetical protein [Caldimonas sp. KR1-144]|uniref:hypothetical protein n=1 Tax=Caldimonas sp. KR1-144 TaxID=3400911 RepID=UPI003C0B266E